MIYSQGAVTVQYTNGMRVVATRDSGSVRTGDVGIVRDVRYNLVYWPTRYVSRVENSGDIRPISVPPIPGMTTEGMSTETKDVLYQSVKGSMVAKGSSF